MAVWDRNRVRVVYFVSLNAVGSNTKTILWCAYAHVLTDIDVRTCVYASVRVLTVHFSIFSSTSSVPKSFPNIPIKTKWELIEFELVD